VSNAAAKVTELRAGDVLTQAGPSDVSNINRCGLQVEGLQSIVDLMLR